MVSDLQRKIAEAFNGAPAHLFGDAAEGRPDAEEALASVALAVVREHLLGDEAVSAAWRAMAELGVQASDPTLRRGLSAALGDRP